jgi:uncharacterized repeat protein (TIGR03803 family)
MRALHRIPITVLAILAYVSGAAAQSERILYSFAGSPDGATPIAGLTADTDGKIIFGATLGGGSTVSFTDGCGTVFELKRIPSGFAESVIWTFGYDPGGGNYDGCSPQGAPILDAAGNLYGTAGVGGAYSSGTVFELSPEPGGRWTEKILWNFGGIYKGRQDGKSPIAGLTFDPAGNLYGATFSGGGAVNSLTCGTIFSLSPSGGSWSETVLHSFPCEKDAGGPHPADGMYPAGGVTLDSAGNLYGATTNGGRDAHCQFGCGTIFELEKAAGWTEVQLYLFAGLEDGAYPNGNLVFDYLGHLCGTTYQGSTAGGAAFELVDAGAGWILNTVDEFTDPAGGWVPEAGVVTWFGPMYGTTAYGQNSTACYAGCGSVFELTHSAGGWTETVLHVFSGAPTDGANPRASLIVDGDGRLYGTTDVGGANNLGTVFEVTP